MFSGDLGQPYGGFPEKVTRNYFKRERTINSKTSELLEPVDFDALKEELFHKLGREVTMFDVVAYALYPKVFMDYEKLLSFMEMYLCLIHRHSSMV